MKPVTHSVLKNTIIKAKAKTDIDRLVDEMKDVLSQTWDKESRAALIEAIRRIDGKQDEITEYELEQIEKTLAKKLGAAFSDKVDDALIQLQEAAFLMGIKEATRGMGVKFAWRLSDIKSMDALNENLMFWVGDYYKENLQKEIKDVLRDFYSGGSDRKKLIEALQNRLGDKFDKSKSYWDLLADHTATKVREIGRVTGYEQAGIRKVEFRARLDEKTTKICRLMHGRIIAVSDMRGQVNGYLDACETQDRTKIKKAWPWITDAQAERYAGMKTEQLVKKGISLPPLHARCRSITVAYFDSFDSDVKIKHGDDLSKGDKKIIDSFSAKEHANSIREIEKNIEKILWNDADFKDDILKHEPVIKHAQKEFGLKTREAYARVSRDIVKKSDAYFIRAFKGMPQYIFASSELQGYTIVDRNWNIRGSYGHRKDFKKCLEIFLRSKMAEMQF
jgi:SPP1 gp7 family putative phage head morphogenesis protein